MRFLKRIKTVTELHEEVTKLKDLLPVAEHQNDASHWELVRNKAQEVAHLIDVRFRVAQKLE